MTYTPPARQGTDPLTEAAALGVKFPKALVDALAARVVAVERQRQATAVAAEGRRGLDEEWLEAKAAHDLAQAAKVGPEAFKPYAEPRPDVGYLQDLASVYTSARAIATRAVDSAASDYGGLFKLLDAAWRELPEVDPSSMTVVEAAGVQAERDAGRSILRSANLAIARASGISDGDRKLLMRTAAAEPDRLPNLDALIAKSRGLTPAEHERAEKVAAKVKADRAAVSASAQESAKARIGRKFEEAAEADAGGTS